MSYSSGLLTAAANYGPIFACAGASVVQLTVNNAAVLVELGDGSPAAPLWRAPAMFKVPGVWTIPGPIDAIRVKAGAPIVTGKEPRYTIDAF